MDLFESIDSVTPPQTDISARQWLESQGASRRMLAIADASFATDFGCTLDELGLRETIAEKQRWDAGERHPTFAPAFVPAGAVMSAIS